jgi:hypothetical protein
MNFPQPGDVAVSGYVLWREVLDLTARGGGLIYMGEIEALAGPGQKYTYPPDPASPSGAAEGLSLWRSPLRFQFSSQVEVTAGQSVLFDVSAAAFGVVAVNVRPA